MNWLGDYHVHTTFCDGKAEAGDLAAQAAALGLTALGFSGHAYTGFDESWCMSRAGTQAYLETLRRLKKQRHQQRDQARAAQQSTFPHERQLLFLYRISRNMSSTSSIGAATAGVTTSGSICTMSAGT